MLRPLLFLTSLLLTLPGTCVRAQQKTLPREQREVLRAVPAPERTTGWGRATIGGAHDNLAVTPSGRLWCATATGHLWRADSLNGSWSYRFFGEDEYDGESFEQTNFFNDSVGILTGYLHDDDYNDHLYRTTDGGKTWKKQPLEKGKWIDAAAVLPSGHGWLASSDQVMYRTSDAGANWTEIRRPEEDTNQRIVQLDFADQHHGLAGTGWNRLYLTTDGGYSWAVLPTPLDQKAYEPLTQSHRPRFTGVLHTGDELFVQQNNTWFYRPLAGSTWKPLANNTRVVGYDFDQLYALRGDTILTAPLPFTGTFQTSDFSTGFPPRDATVANGKLYLIGYGKAGVYDGRTLQTYRTYGHELNVEGIEYSGRTGNIHWGHLDTEIYQKVPPNGNWQRFALLEQPIEAIHLTSDTTAKVRTTSGHYVLQLDNLQFSPFNVRDSLFFPSRKQIRAVEIESSSVGCFHSEQELRTFLPGKSSFKEKNGRGIISFRALEELLAYLPSSTPLGQLARLKLHPEAPSLFKDQLAKAIQEVKEAGKHDHPRLETMKNPERLYGYALLPAERLYSEAYSLAISGECGWSTTVETRKIWVKFRSGPPLEMVHAFSYAGPNYLLWRVAYGKQAFTLPSGLIRTLYVDQMKRKERIAADAELLFQLAEFGAEE